MQLDEYFFFSIIVERSLELELVLFIFSLKLLMQFVISSSRNFLYRNFFPFQLLFFFFQFDITVTRLKGGDIRHGFSTRIDEFRFSFFFETRRKSMRISKAKQLNILSIL